MQDLVTVSTSLIDQESWAENGGSVGSVTFFGSTMLIRNSAGSATRAQSLVSQLIACAVQQSVPGGRQVIDSDGETEVVVRDLSDVAARLDRAPASTPEQAQQALFVRLYKIDPPSWVWNDGGTGFIDYWRGFTLVRQRHELQQKIDEFVAGVRERAREDTPMNRLDPS
jgi:hypothetical protein